MTSIRSIKDWAKGQARAGNTAKGSAFEESIAAYMRLNGWVCEVTKINRSIRRGRWVTIRADYFSCFDILALHQNEPHPVFIQATTSAGAVLQKMKKIDAMFNGFFGVAFDVVVPDNGVGFTVYRRWGRDWSEPRPANIYYQVAPRGEI